ncbi:hypothetical protein [Candidatus Albibeggiatoa sp. nov. BB20]|uniref:hypothetical protein n=1 Tax=Candidatus Albibeggiatoa sp. nov. BB20 TaxID=3162723 RepID=UPI003365459A
MNISDILIHVNESLDSEQRQTVEQAVREIEGVIAPRFSPNKHHLLLVAFNPAVTTTKTLLTSVTSLGYQAQLVGV